MNHWQIYLYTQSKFQFSIALLLILAPFVTVSTSFKIHWNSIISVFFDMSDCQETGGGIHTVKRVKWDMMHWKLIWMWFILIVKELHEFFNNLKLMNHQSFHLYNDVSLCSCLVSRICQQHKTFKIFVTTFTSVWWRVFGLCLLWKTEKKFIRNSTFSLILSNLDLIFIYLFIYFY